MIQKSTDAGFIEGFKVEEAGKDPSDIYRLLYADDFLVFLWHVCDQLWHLKSILAWFEIVSGLCVDLRKSEVFFSGKE